LQFNFCFAQQQQRYSPFPPNGNGNFGTGSPTDVVYSLVKSDDTIFIGGTFNSIGKFC